jgi:hypothetical protein
MKTTTKTHLKYAIASFNKAELQLKAAISNEFGLDGFLTYELNKMSENTQIVVESITELIEDDENDNNNS